MRLKGKNEGEKAAPEGPRPARASAAVPSIVSPEMTVTGNLVSSGEVQIDGHVDGDVQADSLTVGENGQINGTVQAGHLRVLGHIDGEIQADNVTVLTSARVNGDVIHESLAIEAGAMIEGHCRRRSQAATTATTAPSRTRGATGGDSDTDGAAGMPNGRSDGAWVSDGEAGATVS